MSNIVVFVNYEVRSEKRDSYLNLMREIKSVITSSMDIQYNVYESKEKKNYFSEVFKCRSREAFSLFNELSSTSNRLNFLLGEVDKCIKNYTHVTHNPISLAA